MVDQAAAFVKWNVFRPKGGTRGTTSNDFGSAFENLVKIVGKGGTLWLVTSTRKPLRYHLAYKLENCRSIEPADSHFADRWDHAVRAAPGDTTHFRYNDATATVGRLRFDPPRPPKALQYYGLKLMSVPRLSADDVQLLEELQYKIEHGRSAFVSYQREDERAAEVVANELEKRHIEVARDRTMLKPGQKYPRRLEMAVATSDVFVVLLSKSSAKAPWVHRELEWARREMDANGFVKSIVPILLPGGDVADFPELTDDLEVGRFLEGTAATAEFDRIAEGIRATSSPGRRSADPARISAAGRWQAAADLGEDRVDTG